MRDKRDFENITRFQSLVQKSPALICCYLPGGQIAYVNDAYCNYFDKTSEELIGSNFLSLVPEADRETVMNNIASMTADCPTQSHEHSVLTPKGDIAWQRWVNRAIFDDLGGIVEYHAIGEDITERKLSQNQLDKISETLVERTELAEQRAVYIQQLAMELSKAEDRERQRIAEMLHGDLQQMLAYLKLKFNNTIKTSEEDLRFAGINDLIDNCIERCRHLSRELKPFSAHNKDFMSALSQVCRQMKDLYGLAVFLRADEKPEMHSSVLSSLLVRSIKELLFNVVKHSGCEQAWVDVCFEHNQLLVTVKDSGAGCDPADLKTKKENNVAFGLFDIEDRVNFLGGYMHVETSPGNGFCVTLWVPRDVCSPSEIARPAKAGTLLPDIMKERYAGNPPVLPQKGPVRILLADDHAIMRDGLAELIGGYADIEVVGTAANGQEAVELTAILRPSVVLMDVSMPLMNGIEATQLIVDFFPDVQIIGLTMHQDPGIHQAMLSAGARACLSKSGSPQELIKNIRRLSQKTQ